VEGLKTKVLPTPMAKGMNSRRPGREVEGRHAADDARGSFTTGVEFVASLSR
jgi:hypothetical protein